MQDDSWKDLYDFCEASTGPIKSVSIINRSKPKPLRNNPIEFLENEVLEVDDHVKLNEGIEGPDLSFIQNMVQDLNTCYTNAETEQAYGKSDFINSNFKLNPLVSDFIPKSSTNVDEVCSDCEIIQTQDKEHIVDVSTIEHNECNLIDKSNKDDLEVKKMINLGFALNSKLCKPKTDKNCVSEFLSNSPKHKKRVRNVAISSLINKQEKNSKYTDNALIENYKNDIVKNKNDIIEISSSISDISNAKCISMSISSVSSEDVCNKDEDICQDLIYPDVNSREKVIEWLKPSNQYAKNLMNPSKCVSRQPKVYKPNPTAIALYNNLQKKIKNNNSTKNETDNPKSEKSEAMIDTTKNPTIWDYLKDKINEKS